MNSLQLAKLAAEYEAGATVYELATEFNVHRHTVAIRLKKEGVQLRLASPTPADVDDMVRLYESGMALTQVGARTGFAPETVRRKLHGRGARVRDTHGR